jgi:dCMP deaminase
VLGKTLIAEFANLERDIRALSPEEIKLEAKALNLAPDISILEKDDLDELGDFTEIIVPSDEVGRSLVEKYFSEKNIKWETTFLRWNKMNAVTQTPPDSDQTISTEDFDKKMIGLAALEAEKSSDWWRRVGAILVKDGKVIGTRYNKHAVTENSAYIDGEPRSNFDAGKAIADLVIFEHGEASLIAEAARKGEATLGAEIYVTTFPCPSCAMAIANAGIKKVYYKEGYSLLDAQRVLKNAGIELILVKD